MEVKSVPWWRKALGFALSGIRSGFGLFSKTQKPKGITEPENIAGQNEIREEAALTEHLPEQDSTVEAERQVVTVAEHIVEDDAEAAAEPEVTIQDSPETESRPKVELVSEPEVQMLTKEEAAPETALVEEALSDEALPEVTAEAKAAVEVEVETAKEVPALETAQEPEAAAEPEAINEPVVEEEGQKSPQIDSIPQDTANVVASEAELEDLQESSEEPAVLEVAPELHENLKKDEIAEEDAPEPEPPTPEAANLNEPIAETEAEATFKATAKTGVVIVTEDDPVMEEEFESAEEHEAIEASAEQVVELDPVSAEPSPETEMPVQPVAPVAEFVAEQVTEQQVAVENVSVDEPAPQAEAAISEDSAHESASPVPDEMIVALDQASNEAVSEPAAEADELVADQAVEQVDEETAQGNTEAEQSIEVEQTIAEPMELNHPNSEPAAEPDQPVDAAAIAAEESSAAAPEANAEEPAAADEPEAPTAVPVAAQPSKPFIKLEAKEGEANASPFSVIVSQVYDGPLDLLLDLIRKQDIDIYDIPIARITAQFLAYVDQLKATDVDVAGEFIYTASLLIHIKSKMLLPRAPSGPEDATEDPRRELVERLLEHERFKNAAQMLQQKQMLEAATWTNPGIREFKEDAGAEPEIAADTVDLVRVFQDILERARNRPILNVEEDSVTVGQMIQFLSRRLTMTDKPIALRRLLSHTRSERALIAMFLALLELVRLQAILLRQDLAFSEIFIKKHANFESVMNEGVSRDDWK